MQNAMTTAEVQQTSLQLARVLHLRWRRRRLWQSAAAVARSMLPLRYVRAMQQARRSTAICTCSLVHRAGRPAPQPRRAITASAATTFASDTATRVVTTGANLFSYLSRRMGARASLQ